MKFFLQKNKQNIYGEYIATFRITHTLHVGYKY